MTQFFRCTESFSLDPGGLFRCSDFISAAKEFSEEDFFANAESLTVWRENNARQKAENLGEMVYDVHINKHTPIQISAYVVLKVVFSPFPQTNHVPRAFS